MKKTTKKTTNNSKKKLFKVVAIALVVIVLVPVAISVINNLQTRQAQIDRLERASEDLHGLYDKFISGLNVDSKTASFWKRCGQASAKFNSGVITCGPRGEFVQDKNYAAAKAERVAEQVLRKDNKFNNIRVDEININSETWTSIDFDNVSTGVKCYVDFGNNESTTFYHLGCNETVPDFLPGYEKQQ